MHPNGGLWAAWHWQLPVVHDICGASCVAKTLKTECAATGAAHARRPFTQAKQVEHLPLVMVVD
jgi:hypothetical protein